MMARHCARRQTMSSHHWKWCGATRSRPYPTPRSSRPLPWRASGGSLLLWISLHPEMVSVDDFVGVSFLLDTD